MPLPLPSAKTHPIPASQTSNCRCKIATEYPILTMARVPILDAALSAAGWGAF
jgi:hypothetical protein